MTCFQVFQDNDLGLFEIQLEYPPEYEEAMVDINRQGHRMADKFYKLLLSISNKKRIKVGVYFYKECKHMIIFFHIPSGNP